MQAGRQEGANMELNSEIKRAIRLRLRLAAGLSVLLLAIFVGNLLLMSGLADLAAYEAGGGAIPPGIAYSLFLIGAGAAASLLYVWVANRIIDPLIARSMKAPALNDSN